MPATKTAGDPVIDFTLAGIDGARYSSRETRADKLLLFVFWKKSCGTCQFTFPYLQRLQEQYSGVGFAIWGISQENREDTAEFVKSYSATFPQLIDEGLELTERYGLISVPSMYLVDGSDTILRHAPAFVKDELNAIAKQASARTGRPYIPVVRPEDDAPDIKPG